MSPASPRVTLGVLASCVVHAGVVLGLHGHTRAREPLAARPLWFELQLETRAPANDPAPVAASLPTGDPLPSDSASTPPTARRGARPISARAPEGALRPRAPATPAATPAVPTATSEPPSAVTTSTEPAAPEPRAEAVSAPSLESVGGSPRPRFDLSPLAAAHALLDDTNVGRDAGPRRALPEPAGESPDEHELASQVPGLRDTQRRSAHGAVEDAVEDAIYTLLKPWKLLQRTTKGSAYRYTGGGFDAAILPDGRVRFREKDGLRLSTFVTQTFDMPNSAMQPPPAAVSGISVGDPASLFSRLRGEDPFAAERRTFLERTRELREHLARRAVQHGASDADLAEPEPEPEPKLEPRLEPKLEPKHEAR